MFILVKKKKGYVYMGLCVYACVLGIWEGQIPGETYGHSWQDWTKKSYFLS